MLHFFLFVRGLIIAKDRDRIESRNFLAPYPKLLNPRSINLLIGDYGANG